MAGMLVGGAMASAPASVMAQEPPPVVQPTHDRGGDGPTAFEAAKDGDVVKEHLPAWPFLYGSYFAILVLLMGYLISLWVRQRRLDAEIDRLDKKLDRLDEMLGQRKEAAEGGS